MQFGFNFATYLCFLTMSIFAVLSPACRDSDSAVVDHEHEDLVCPEDETLCTLAHDDEGADKSVCANLNTDNGHCGACNTPCAGEELCIDGQCKADDQTSDCEADRVDCGDEENTLCVDTDNDNEHCGACNNSCELGMERCYGGECVQVCPKGYETCGAECCHWESYCSREESAQCTTVNCLTGSPCGNGCCAEDQYCGPGSICHDRCDAGETVCGDACCHAGQVCVEQRCTAR